MAKKQLKGNPDLTNRGETFSFIIYHQYVVLVIHNLCMCERWRKLTPGGEETLEIRPDLTNRRQAESTCVAKVGPW